MRVFLPNHPHPLILKKILIDEKACIVVMRCQVCRKDFTKQIRGIG